MSRYLAVVFVIMSTLAIPAIAQEPVKSSRLTSDVQALSQVAYKQCLVERETRLAKTQAENPDALPIMKSLFSETYCGCAAEGIDRQLQPSIISKLSQSEARRRIILIYQQCALANFQNELPSMCKLWYQGLFPEHERISEEQQSSGCRCMKEATSTLLPEDLPEIAKQTVQDYQDWRANPVDRFVAARPKSILGSLGQCLRKEGLLR